MTTSTTTPAYGFTRADLAQKILYIKREKGLTWKTRSPTRSAACPPVLVVGAILGQHKLVQAVGEEGGRR